MRIDFTKMQGAGNDYIYIDCMRRELGLTADDIAWLSDRHFGVGGDGVILICPSAAADGRMEMYNKDGSGAMCGNGLRCVASYLYNHNYAKKERITVETVNGIRTLDMIIENGAAIGAAADMGAAILNNADIPVLYEGSNIDIPIEAAGRCWQATCVSMGNPHAVVFVDDVKSLDLETIGPAFEKHPLFPQGVNAEFARVISETEIEMRVWERGSGETLACGTGACAAAVAAVLKGKCNRGVPVVVYLPGGDLTVTYLEDGRVILSGGAREVFWGWTEMDGGARQR